VVGREREGRPVRREKIVLVRTLEYRYVSEPVETNYLTFLIMVPVREKWNLTAKWEQ
jgi:hypothetical protein